MTDKGFKTYSAHDAPRQMIAVAEEVMAQLLAGDHPILDTLRRQYALANIESVELSGVGFFINYQIPDDAPTVSPPNFEGGCADIEVEGTLGAGCVLFVRDGRIEMFEAYTYDGDWWEDTKVLSINDVTPLSKWLPEIKSC